MKYRRPLFLITTILSLICFAQASADRGIPETPEEAARREMINSLDPDEYNRQWLETHESESAGKEDFLSRTSSNEKSGSIINNLEKLYPDTDPVQIPDGTVIPERFDLRELNRVSPVRDQENYETCWAFGALASLESNLITQGLADPSIDLSELQLVHFGYNRVDDPLKLLVGDKIINTKSGRNADLKVGGNNYISSQILTSWIGPVSESLVPYNHEDELFNLDSDLAFQKDSFHVQNVDFVSPLKSMDAMKLLLMENGAGTVTGYYNESYYDEKKHSYNYPNDGESGILHDVVVVGWDDHYPKENFIEKPPADGAWIAKNSWGTDWGENGYFYISYYDIGFSESRNQAFFYSAENANNYERCYQYDGSGGFYYLVISKAANVFTAQEDEELKAVSFSTLDTNFDYSIQIYRGMPDPNNPESGQLVSVQSGKENCSGFHTIQLDQPALIKSGEKFVIVVDIDTEKSDYGNYFVDKTAPSPNTLTFISHGEKGQSFAKVSDVWYDLNPVKKPIDVAIICRIKGYTVTPSSSTENSYLEPLISGLDVINELRNDDPLSFSSVNAEDTFSKASENSNGTEVKSVGKSPNTGVGFGSNRFFWFEPEAETSGEPIMMPATGFPTGGMTILPDIENELPESTGFRLAIPSLDMDAEVAFLERRGTDYDILGLGSEVGVLEGTALPGEGFSIIVGHNHLNTQEAGPFALLQTVQEGVRVFITDAEDQLKIYQVTANLLLAPDDMESLEANISEDSIVLITCEDETLDGTYLHRRVVFASPSA